MARLPRELPTYWLLSHLTRWGHRASGDESAVEPGGISEMEGVAAGPRGISLEPRPGSLLSFGHCNQSLGGLRLPPFVAVDEDGLTYILLEDRHLIRRFNPGSGRFEVLETIGGCGPEPRQLMKPKAIAICRGDLYVVDPGNHRVQVFALKGLVLRSVWGPWEVPASSEPGESEPQRRWWKPIDVAFDDVGNAYVLDAETPAVWEVSPRSGRPHVVISGDRLGSNASRIFWGKDRALYVLRREDRIVARFWRASSGEWRKQERTYGSAEELVGRFPDPPLRLDGSGRFCLPEELARECGREAPPPPPPDRPLASCRDGKRIFDRNGDPVALSPDVAISEPIYRCEGRIMFGPLDSEIYRCQWHRIELDLGSLPAGTSVKVRTYTDDKLTDDGPGRSIDDLQGSWVTATKVVSGYQEAPEDTAAPPNDTLVQSREGRYCWVLLELGSDGYATPAIGSLKLHFPRTSYLEHLPAVFQEDRESAWFLQRFLSLFQTTWDDLRHHIDDTPKYFDPEAVPESHLDFLSGWLGLDPDPDAPAAQRRRRLWAAIKTRGRRGTPDGLKDWIRAHLDRIPEEDREALPQVPFILEGHTARNWVFLARETVARRSEGGRLWGAGVVGRARLDQYSRIGDFQLFDTGHADRDVIDQHSNRFTVFVPAALAPTRGDADKLRQVIEDEKPAHTLASLHLVEPRYRVGVQSTIGVDSIIGAYPQLTLGSWDQPQDVTVRPPSSVLGYDSVLAASPDETKAPSVQLGRRAMEPGLRLD